MGLFISFGSEGYLQVEPLRHHPLWASESTCALSLSLSLFKGFVLVLESAFSHHGCVLINKSPN